jgi:hypothetical protein
MNTLSRNCMLHAYGGGFGECGFVVFAEGRAR